MSREIKLRVWDITNQMWLKSFNANLLNVGDLTIVIISQYTEQKDDYGNEIFEDDFIIDVSEDGDYFLKLIGFGYDDREYSSILKGFKIVKGIQLDLYFDNKEGIFKGKDKDGKEVQKSVVLTSAVKNIEVAVTKILNEIKADKFQNGKHTFGIKENGVGIPKENPNLNDDIKGKLTKAIEELKSGKVEVVATGDELKAKGSVTNIEGEL